METHTLILCYVSFPDTTYSTVLSYEIGQKYTKLYLESGATICINTDQVLAIRAEKNW